MEYPHKKSSERIKPLKKKMTKSQQMLAILKKKECDAKAQRIVEKLLDHDVDRLWLQKHLQYINKSHMEDVIEERSIEKICGYPLCYKPLTKIISQRYHISMKTKKVYDVSRRKNFCSSFCYCATNYLLEQMFTSPLWLREKDQVCEFRFLTDTHKTGTNIPGEEIIISGEHSITKDELETNEPECFSETPSETKESPKNENFNKSIFNEEDTLEEINLEVESKSFLDQDENLSKIANDDTKKITLEMRETKKTKNKSVTFQIPDEIDRNAKAVDTSDSLLKNIIMRENVDPVVNTVTKNLRKESKFQRERKSSNTGSKNTLESLGCLVKRIEEIFKDWFTEETHRLLIGEEKTKYQVFEKVIKQEKYAALCKKLNQLELEDERENRSILEKTLSKVPDYSFLQEEGKKLQIEVREFHEDRTASEMQHKTDNKEDAEKEEDSNPVFPLTESRAPKAIRRRIFLEKINNILPDLIRALSGNGQVLPERFAYSRERVTVVEALISTFALKADNIVFKSAEWTLVGLIIIKMLSAMDPELKHLFNTKQASLYTSMILMSYQLDSNYLDTFINSLTNEICNKDKSTT